MEKDGFGMDGYKIQKILGEMGFCLEQWEWGLRDYGSFSARSG